jgi:NhaP-type Na+/H+ or K+/H+ antiporter
VAVTFSLLGINLTFDNTQDAMTWLLALIAVLTAFVRLVVWPMVKFARRLETVMTNVESQLYPNGGSTLRDAVSSIQKELGITVQVPPHDPNHSREG